MMRIHRRQVIIDVSVACMLLSTSTCCGGFVAGVHREGRNTARSPRIQASDNEIFGLTEDGDFAIMGINFNDPTTSVQQSNDESSPLTGIQGLGLESGSALTSHFGPTGITKSGSNLNVEAAKIFNQDQTTLKPSFDTNPTKNRQDNFHDEKAEEDIQLWLMEVISTLKEGDLIFYSKELMRIGFDPNCVTQSELRFEDLSFMKILHQRYLYNKISGNDHP